MSACGGATVEGALNRTGDPSVGLEVFADRCAACHGWDGGGGIGPDLRDKAIPRRELAERVILGRGEMEGFADELSNQEAADLLAFLELAIVGADLR